MLQHHYKISGVSDPILSVGILKIDDKILKLGIKTLIKIFFHYLTNMDPKNPAINSVNN